MDTPEILYHYTDAKGLAGILKENQIWASSYRFMSDAQEFNYGFNLISELFPENSPDSVFAGLIRNWEKFYEYDVIFVASFSADGDSLGQWRGYAGLHSGYSLGFFSKNLKSTAEVQLVACCYDKQRQLEEVRSRVDKYFQGAREVMNSPAPDPIDLLALATEAQKELVPLFPSFKDSAFYQEEEWRLVVGPLAANDERICYRPGERVIIPCFKMDYRTKRLPLKQIIVGPGPHQQRSVRSLHQMLAVKKISGVEVISSKIPFRTW